MNRLFSLLALLALAAPAAAQDQPAGNPRSGYDYKIFTNGGGGPATRMWVKSSGRVGIGTSAPGQPLSVVGVIESTSGGFKFPDGSVQTSAGGAIGGPLGGGTAGSVLFVGSGPTMAQDNANLFWDDTTNSLGIGTASPTAKLEVSGTGYFTGQTSPTAGAGVDISYAGGVGTIQSYDWTGTLSKPLYVSGTPLLLNPGGSNVGVGTASPSERFQVSGGRSTFRDNSNPFALSVCYNDSQCSTDPFFLGVRDNGGSATAGKFQLSNANGDALVNVTYGGNVGIGTTNPGVDLDVAGAIRATALSASTSGEGLDFEYDPGDAGFVSSFSRATSTFKPLRINGSYVNLQSDSGGKVGVRTNTPDALLDVNGQFRVQGGSFGPSTGSGIGLAYLDPIGYIASYNAGTSTFQELHINANPLVLNADISANVGVGTASPAAKVHVSGGTYNTSFFAESALTSGVGLDLKSTDTGGHEWSLISNGSANSGGAGGFQFVDLTASATRLFISPSGSFGIGTTAPGELLELAGNVLLKNPSGAQPRLRLSEDPDNGTSAMSIEANASMSANFTLTLPPDDGTAGQVLATDGSGALSWASYSLQDAYGAGNTITTSSGSGYVVIAGDQGLDVQATGGSSVAHNGTAAGALYVALSNAASAQNAMDIEHAGSGVGIQVASNGSSVGLVIGGSSTSDRLKVKSGGGSDLVAVQANGAVVVSETGGNGGNVPHEMIRRSSTTTTSASCAVTCSAGERALGGGCQNTAAENLRDSYPSADATWTCLYNGATGDCTAWAVCADY